MDRGAWRAVAMGSQESDTSEQLNLKPKEQPLLTAPRESPDTPKKIQSYFLVYYFPSLSHLHTCVLDLLPLCHMTPPHLPSLSLRG